MRAAVLKVSTTAILGWLFWLNKSTDVGMPGEGGAVSLGARSLGGSRAELGGGALCL